MAKLVFIDQAFSGQVYQLTLEKTTVGRADENTLVIRDKSLSSAHCEILVHEPEVLVRDLGSRNGTVVNGRKLRKQQAQVKHGQVIRFGSVEARLELEGDPHRQTTDSTAVHEHVRWMHEAAKPKLDPGNPAMSIECDAPPDANQKTVLIPTTANLAKSDPRPSAAKETDRPGETTRSLILIAGLVLIGLLAFLWLTFAGK